MKVNLLSYGRYLLIVTALMWSFTSQAADSDVSTSEAPSPLDSTLALLGGLGVNSDTGVLGLQARWLFDPNLYVPFTLALDLRGVGFGAGLGWQTTAYQGTCLFFVDCAKRYRFSSSLIRYSGGDFNVGGSERECEDGFCVGYSSEGAKYKGSDSLGANVSLAWQDQFGSTFFYELEVGYLFMIKTPTYTYQSGPKVTDHINKLERLHKSQLGLGIKIGFYL